MHPQKLASVLALNGRERFEYFVRKIADFEELWGLFHKGWAMGKNSEGQLAVLFWPEQEFADHFRKGEYSRHISTKIDLDSFINRWIPGMSQDHYLAGVFPNSAGDAVFVDPEILLKAIEDEQHGLESDPD